MKNRIKKFVAGVATTVLITTVACGLAACGDSESSDLTSNGSISRVKIYQSLASLQGDSDVIVTGTVLSQKTVQDIDGVTDFTLSTVKVLSSSKGKHKAGDTIVVRQIGSTEQTGYGEMMKVQSTYLLFLTESGLSGGASSQYYVTGVTAGIYVSNTLQPSSDASVLAKTNFQRFDPDSGDNLPATVKPGDLS